MSEKQDPSTNVGEKTEELPLWSALNFELNGQTIIRKTWQRTHTHYTHTLKEYNRLLTLGTEPFVGRIEPAGLLPVIICPHPVFHMEPINQSGTKSCVADCFLS